MSDNKQPTEPAWSGEGYSGLEHLVRWRRDVRRFKPDPVDPNLLDGLLRLADLSPSVGNSQPWRVVNVASPAMRRAVSANFEMARIKAAGIYDAEKAEAYGRLKLAGFDAAPVHLAVFCDRSVTQGHGLGRQSIPEALDQSCACMVTVLWLAARERGLGLGWVSILDPDAVARTLDVPASWKFIGYLLVGWPQEEHLDPELERHGWQARTAHEARFLTAGALQGEPCGAATSPAPERLGKVTLVGAGPGDPELLTLKALKALDAADAVLFDDLVAERILDLINPRAELFHVGKRGYRQSCKQPDINAKLVELAKAGRKVVRLKGGDPLIFGRAGEEIATCRDAGVEIDVVPGVTSAQGAAASLKVSLTHRDHARRLQFITAHDRRGSLPTDIDWSTVADSAATTVIYMPKRTLGELTEIAMRHGLDPNTPAVAVANATRPDELVLKSTVKEIASKLGAAHPDGPVLILIGEAFRYVTPSDIADVGAAAALTAARELT